MMVFKQIDKKIITKMNKIVNKIKTNKVAFVRGSIWKDSVMGLYILASSDFESYCAINLRDGNRWKDGPRMNMEEAVSGLTFVAESAEITVANRNDF
jgi:hypothetical protein